MLMINNPSTTDLIRAFLLSARSSKRFHEIIHQQEIAKCNEGTVHVTLFRMRKGGYIQRTRGGWVITEKGLTGYTSKNVFGYIISPFKSGLPSNTIIAFDIPEKYRPMRDWLRKQLKIFGYKMIQKSLWRGQGPLPEEFKKRLVSLGIKERVKIFALSNKRK